MAATLKNRLLLDIAELQEKPYPNIELHIQDDDLKHACLVLMVDRYGAVHMTIDFPENYPLSPPRIRMDSDISHPNIFGSYICASILNTTEGYTPAYTLKGIAIQMLSFFSSDRIEQEGGAYSVDLATFSRGYRPSPSHAYKCEKCGHGAKEKSKASTIAAPAPTTSASPTVEDSVDREITPKQTAPVILGRNARRRKAKQNAEARSQASKPASVAVLPPAPVDVATPPKSFQDRNIPNEVLLLICDQLDTEEVVFFAQAWSRIAGLMTRFDFIRTRELQCFCLKKDFKSVTLGIGVQVSESGKFGTLSSEFDLLSYEAFHTHGIRRSVHGVEFRYWLPLPISNGHFRRVQGNINTRLGVLATAARLPTQSPEQVIYHFMNEVVVKLNQAGAATVPTRTYPYEVAHSTLTHASEKAIESYFHLFHLLLCLATSTPSIVHSANALITSFSAGRNSKTDVPNLGHLLVASLISTVPITESILKAIIKETVIRNTVWMLDSKGAGMAQLAYMEESAVSEYRLKKTFEASTTSYRLLMFLNLFRRTAVGTPPKPLAQLRDEAFERHGAPPRGSAKGLANSIKRIHQVSNFPDFLQAMGVGRPSAQWFTTFLRDCVEESVRKGYSRMPLDQGQALWLRLMKEPDVEVKHGLIPTGVEISRLSFFPGMGREASYGAGRGRGDRRR